MDASTTVEDVEVSTLHWIGGERVGSAGAFADVSPIDETVIARVARGGADEAEQAVAAARRAFAEWCATPPPERARAAEMDRIAATAMMAISKTYADWR
jgi:acyl-CoA reductase-like NAD-dependent aldehyde dehydrogenase